MGRALQSLMQWSRIFQLVNEIRFQRRQRALIAERDQKIGEAGLDSQIYNLKIPPIWENAWTVTDKLIAATKAESERLGAMFLLTSTSNGIQVDPRDIVREKYAKDNKVDNFFQPEHRLAQIAARNSIEYLPLAPQLYAYAKKQTLTSTVSGLNLVPVIGMKPATSKQQTTWLPGLRPPQGAKAVRRVRRIHLRSQAPTSVVPYHLTALVAQ